MKSKTSKESHQFFKTFRVNSVKQGDVNSEGEKHVASVSVTTTLNESRVKSERI